MQTTTVRLYSLGYGQAKTYWTAFLFVAGNVLLPQLCHLFPLGGVRWLPIYFFTLVGAYKYGWRVGLLTAVASPCFWPERPVSLPLVFARRRSGCLPLW